MIGFMEETMSFVAVFNVCFLLFISSANAQTGIEPDWSAQSSIDPRIFPNGRSNIYQWDAVTFAEKVKKGQEHAIHYPVSLTGLLLPARPMLKILDSKPGDPLFGLMKTIFSLSKDFKDFNGFWDWLGLTPPLKESGEKYPMGVSIVSRSGVDGFTLSWPERIDWSSPKWIFQTAMRSGKRHN